MSKKMRIDQLMLEKALVESRSQAQRLVMAGQVRVDGQMVPKPSSKYSLEAEVSIDEGPRFVSRGGEKLQAAFDAFNLDVSGKVCADVGASTGGFTDCLLQHGAMRVYAIDVGKGLLHWKLRNHPRVKIMEETNARYLDKLDEPVSFVTVDVSFISIKVILSVIRNWYLDFGVTDVEKSKNEGSREIILLIKPQFEAGRKVVAKGKGVVRDPEVHRKVLLEVLKFSFENGFYLQGLVPSPILGPKGNIEFLAWLKGIEGKDYSHRPLEDIISAIVPIG